MSKRAAYGVDGYPYVVGLVGGGSALLIVGAAFAGRSAGALQALGLIAAAAGAIALVPGLLGLRYVLFGKRAHRDALLARVPWRGDERVLDVGTGAGLLLIGAAKRVPRGRAVGVDIWNVLDLSGNTRERTARNAVLEGVAERVEVRDVDARALPFPDASFDVVLSTLCLHNVSERQEQALQEIVRVLAPGGTVVVSDLADTERYAEVFARAGLVVQRSGIAWRTFPFQRVVTARKTARGAPA